MYLVHKTILNMVNGDTVINKEKVKTPDIECLRNELHEQNIDCKTVEFVYEEVANERSETNS